MWPDPFIHRCRNICDYWTLIIRQNCDKYYVLKPYNMQLLITVQLDNQLTSFVSRNKQRGHITVWIYCSSMTISINIMKVNTEKKKYIYLNCLVKAYDIWTKSYLKSHVFNGKTSLVPFKVMSPPFRREHHQCYKFSLSAALHFLKAQKDTIDCASERLLWRNDEIILLVPSLCFFPIGKLIQGENIWCLWVNRCIQAFWEHL